MVTESVFRQAKTAVEAAGGRFYVALLRTVSKTGVSDAPLVERLERAGIDLIDAVPPIPWEETTFAPYDPHPNATTNRYFAEKIGDVIADAPRAGGREGARKPGVAAIDGKQTMRRVRALRE